MTFWFWFSNMICRFIKKRLSNFLYLLRLLVKHNALQVPFLPSLRSFRGFGIVNRYSRFWNSLNIADRGGEFSFFQGFHVKLDTRIDISNSVRPMTTKFDKLVNLEKLTQMRLIKQVLVTSSGQYQMTLKKR